MFSRAVILCGAALLCNCTPSPQSEPVAVPDTLDAMAERMAANTGTSPVRPKRPSPEPETAVNDRDAAALRQQFDLPHCAGIRRLRDVREGGVFAESWRVRGDAACFADWARRVQRFTILAQLDKTQAERDRLPWLCEETGGHVLQCSDQGRTTTLVIEQPRFAPFLLLRRITPPTG